MTEYYAANDDLHQSAKGAQKNAELAQSLMKIGDTEMDTSKIYTFKNTNSGLVMDIVNGKMEDGSNVQQWGSNGLSCQQWTLTPFMNGTTYTMFVPLPIRTMFSRQCQMLRAEILK